MQRLKNNQNRLEKIRSTQILEDLAFIALGILSWLGFSFLITLYLKIMQGGSIYRFPWHWDAPFWTFLDCLFGATIIIFIKWKFNLFSEKSKSLWRDFLILLSLIPVNAFVITAFSIIILGLSFTGRKNITSYEWVMGFLHDIFPQIFVSLTCVGYFYLNLINKTKEKLRQAQEAKTAMELKTLQQNIEPHFLFNNLNVLSSLIESNPDKANDFLSSLAELYRYILQTQTLEVVRIKDELTFAENYIYLLRERFGDAYDFAWEVPENKLNGQMIVPVALQTLIENAVKHNAGSNEKPLPISIRLEEDSVSVENEIRAKQLTFQSNQSGLQNLQTRYAFLTEKPIEISQTNDSFKVKLPLIRKQ
jgi:hypothetical protein